MRGFKVAGKTIAGFAAFKNHLSYLPHSGSVFPQLADALSGYAESSGALRFPVDQPLPFELVEKLIGRAASRRRPYLDKTIGVTLRQAGHRCPGHLLPNPPGRA